MSSRALTFAALTCISRAMTCAWQSDVPPATKHRQIGAQEPLRTAQASAVDRAPKLDGTLQDPLWQQATAITSFLQREPYEGQNPTERTEVRVLYTKNAVFFGITCFDSDYKAIIATELRRDVSQELDDYFEIIIDSAAMALADFRADGTVFVYTHTQNPQALRTAIAHMLSTSTGHKHLDKRPRRGVLGMSCPTGRATVQVHSRRDGRLSGLICRKQRKQVVFSSLTTDEI